MAHAGHQHVGAKVTHGPYVSGNGSYVCLAFYRRDKTQPCARSALGYGGEDGGGDAEQRNFVAVVEVT
jgi:hypothetical protein